MLLSHLRYATSVLLLSLRSRSEADKLMDSSTFDRDVEHQGPKMAADAKSKDGRKKVLVVGAGAAGSVISSSL